MKRKSPRSYIMILAAGLLLMSIPKTSGEKLRGTVVAFMAPAWEYLNKAKLSAFAFGDSIYQTEQNSDLPAPQSSSNEEIQRLTIENLLLAQEVETLREVLNHKRYLSEQKLNEFHSQAIPARVIFRSPSTWNSSLWINVGKADNAELGRTLIAKNSPIVSGKSVIGVIDYVGERQSRVRLITDSGLTPSVRSVRGTPYNGLLSENIHFILEGLSFHKDVWLSSEDQQQVVQLLTKLQTALNRQQPSLFLAKGEVHGSSKPLWRTQGRLLKGVGFNYDFPDEHGSARDLRTGKPIPDDGLTPATPILKVNDLLITTGMDGVFPPGLHVAQVTNIHMLKEGDYAYELEAKPTAGNLDELSLVFVIPPLGYDGFDKPPVVGR